MRKLLFTTLIIFNITAFSQTIKIHIDAMCLTYNALYNKAIVAVKDRDENYPNNLLQLDPYSGNLEKSLLLNDNPIKIIFTPDNQKVYVIYKSLSQIDKVDLASFQIIETLYVDEYNVLDLVVLPTNENYLFVVLGDGEYPDKTVMLKNGIIQPNQVDDSRIWATSLSIKNDGTKLYGHNGINTGFHGYIFDVVEDGIIWDGTVWHYMIPSFGDIKNHHDLIYGRGGHVVDPFSDSIPLREAYMPLMYLTDSRPRCDFSEIHGCYIFGHETDYSGYISFFHGQYYNYMGSLKVCDNTDNIWDVDVVDQNHFIVISYDTHNNYKNSLLFYSVRDSKNSIPYDTTGQITEDWFKNDNLISLPIIVDSINHFYRD